MAAAPTSTTVTLVMKVAAAIPTVELAQVAAAASLYEQLNAQGIETLLDDRKERAGVKFKDAELIGIPFRVVTGRAIAQGKVEMVIRANGEASEIAIEDVVETLQSLIAQG